MTEVHYIDGVPLNYRSAAPRRKTGWARKRGMESAKLTFFQLKQLLAKRIQSGSDTAASSLPNLQSALNGFLNERRLAEEGPVGSIFRSSYYINLHSHLQSLKNEGRPSAYIANRKSLLAQWRKCVIEYDRYCAVTLKQATPFQRAILDIFESGVTKKGLARAAEIPLATLNRWCTGKVPNAMSLPHVVRVERYLGLSPGALGDLLTVRPSTSTAATTQLIAYRERLKVRNKDRYAVTQPTSNLRTEWSEFLQYKVSELCEEDDVDSIKRSRGGRWSSTTSPVASPRPSNWARWFRGRFVPTAGVAWSYVSQYLGWMALPTEQGGCGLSPEQAQTLAHFANRQRLRAYIEWKRERAGGMAHQGLLSLLRFASSLCNPQTGYLTQRWRAFAERNGTTEEAWRERCTRTFESIARLRAELADDSSPSRDSTEPIQHVLALANPLDAIAEMVIRMSAARPATGGIREAVWARDLLLVKLSASNPLRDKNLRTLTYRADNTGNVRQDANGCWFVFVPRRELKNHKGAAKDRDYSMHVRREVWPDIERYIKEFRPMLARGETDILFLTERRGGGFSEDAMGARFYALTKRYLHGCPGVGPHAMRHIVATSILKSSPNDWAAAAWALHDREETVRQHYAHLAQNDAAGWMSKAMDGPFSRM